MTACIFLGLQSHIYLFDSAFLHHLLYIIVLLPVCLCSLSREVISFRRPWLLVRFPFPKQLALYLTHLTFSNTLQTLLNLSDLFFVLISRSQVVERISQESQLLLWCHLAYFSRYLVHCLERLEIKRIINWMLLNG